ncbi:MAG: ABC transporter permease [Vicinamibacterales bacterium]
MTGHWSDIREAARRMRLEWRFTATVVTTFAAGIAGTAAMFGVVNNALFRPLPLADEARLVRVQQFQVGPDGTRIVTSNWARSFYGLRDRAASSDSSFDAVAGFRGATLTLAGTNEPLSVSASFVSPGALDLLGLPPAAGRVFTADEARLGRDSGVAVISYALWQQHYGGAPDIVGRAVQLDDRPVTIVGVMPRGFRFPYLSDVWTPEIVEEAAPLSLLTIARLAPGVTLAAARSELHAVAAAVGRAYPDTADMGLQATPLRTSVIGDDGQVALLLFGAVGLLLVLACANVATLLLARGVRRTREIAVRAALGASRARQTRSLLVESLVLAAAGAIAGLGLTRLLASTATMLVPHVLRDELALGDAAFDWRAALFVTAVTTAAGVLAGLLPALRASRADVAAALRTESRGATGGHQLMSGLVVSQIAMAALLLFGAGLLTDHLQRLLDRNLGLRPDGLMAIQVGVPQSRYAEPAQRASLVTRLTEALEAAPGIEAASVASINPLERGNWGAPIDVAGQPPVSATSAPVVNHRLVGPHFFETMGIPILRGRGITAGDTAESAPVAVISARMAERFWPGADPVGQRVRIARPDRPWFTVVGIAGDVEDWGDWEETWYLPYAQHAGAAAGDELHLMLRSPLDEAALVRTARAAIGAVDATLPVPSPTPMRALYESTLERERLGSTAAALFALSGLLLAAVGVYGVLAYAVSERAREFGIRLAIGATPRQVRRGVLQRAAGLVAAGLAAAAAGGVWLARALPAFIDGMDGSVPPHVPAAVFLALACCAGLAAFVPARRATAVDPMRVMRSE